MDKSIEQAKSKYESVINKFRSGNAVQVERASVTRKELDGFFRYWLFKLTDNHLNQNSDIAFDEWAKDPFTHWTCDEDAAYQAWCEQQEKIDILEARIKNLESGEAFDE